MNSNKLLLQKVYSMRLLTLLFLIIALQGVALSQQLKTTYYDPLTQTKIKEKYSVNSVGEKNGAYTLYEQNGVIWVTANYKNGKLDGLRKSYNSSSGVQVPTNTETYSEGYLEGSATYFSGDGKVVVQEGVFKNGKKEGKWTFRREYINYDLTKEEKKGSEYYTYSDNYSEDNVVPTMTDGQFKTYFYPSGKIYQEIEYGNGKRTGQEKIYFPNGTIQSERNIEGSNLSEKEYWLGGKLKVSRYYENGKLSKYEGYEKDGSPDSEMLEYEKKMKMSDDENRVMNYIDSAATAIKSGNVNKAIEYYTTVGLSSKFITRFNQLWDEYQAGKMPKEGFDTFEFRYQALKGDYSFDDKNGTPVAQLQYAQDIIQKGNERLKRVNELKDLIISKQEKYNSLYVSSKNSMFVDQNNNPVVKETYPKGEYLYKKSAAIIQELITDYNNELLLDNKLEKGMIIAEKYDLMIRLAASDTEEINKKLKKMENREEIITLLGF
jgi:antitoxin component YwqK of YwqJK toxin-antitoxin module